ncbi:MAG: right-handed parallel beta-helix repeat-containing protein, partial [Candidatus Sumerlaeota bacterium]|nr:right-handed parallel beta-helix repeat-containing protein [Candidatus Sumerlaeota bacterium]
PDRNAQFRYHEGDIRPEWARQQGVEVVALCKWQQYRIPIASVDAAAQTATLAGARMPNGADVNPRYWVENTLDALDAPGEWFLERETGILYYRPMPDEDLNTAETVAPFLERLVEFAGDAKAGRYVHDITLRGFALCHTDWSLGPSGYSDMQAASEIPAAIDLRGARSCAIENCVLSHLGQYAVGVGMGSKENRVAANEMTDLGAGGVKIGDAQCNAHPMRGPSDAPTEQGGPNGREGANYPQSDQETTSGNVVSDNDIHDIGAVFASAVGVWIGQSYGNTVAHNEIHDTYYSGISLGWTWGWGRTAAHDNLIEQNHIHHIGRGLLCDMGCIYTLGFQPGTALRNNLCHDVERYEKKPAGFQADSTTPEGLVENQTGYGGWGLYLDSASSRILVENNVVYNTQDGAYHNQYGQENTVRNNIFALGTRAQLTRHYRGAKKPSFFFDHNIIYWKTGLLQWGMWGDGLYEMDHNLYFRADGQPIEFGKLSFEQWQAERGQDKNSRIADPMFVDPDHGDFTLKPGSPALQLGFQPIDLSHVGPRQKAGIPSGGGR